MVRRKVLRPVCGAPTTARCPCGPPKSMMSGCCSCWSGRSTTPIGTLSWPELRPRAGGQPAAGLHAGRADQAVHRDRRRQRRQPDLVHRPADHPQPVDHHREFGRAVIGTAGVSSTMDSVGRGADVERDDRRVQPRRPPAGPRPRRRAPTRGPPGSVGRSTRRPSGTPSRGWPAAGTRPAVPMTVRLSAALNVRRQIR